MLLISQNVDEMEICVEVLFELGLINGERYEMLLEGIWNGNRAAREEAERLLSKIELE